ncbi:hypothetical protein SLEP1_g20525 [Rubroshorea leprosula]|uniref:Uncharacterized protein n=1 Tax=Rubroshorea leprosula TaxID=152421 RepID=A0AAV5J930_9ROSI|nr:hypothetical protein SLEP1_g20525 [Rubroshorea leprosula]
MNENGEWRLKHEGSIDGKIGWQPSFTYCLTTVVIRSPTVFSCDVTTCIAPTLPCIVMFKNNFVNFGLPFDEETPRGIFLSNRSLAASSNTGAQRLWQN